MEDRDENKVVLLDIAHAGATAVKIGLVGALQLLVDAIDEARRGKRMLGGDGNKATAGESAEVLVVQPLDMVAKEYNRLSLEPKEREGLVERRSVLREGEDERLVGHGGLDGRAEGLHELRRRAGGVVGNPSIVVGYRLVRVEMAVFLVGVAAATRKRGSAR